VTCSEEERHSRGDRACGFGFERPGEIARTESTKGGSVTNLRSVVAGVIKAGPASALVVDGEMVFVIRGDA
jgi:hypothetical protein